jgi:valyl-tRNA synthetase
MLEPMMAWIVLLLKVEDHDHAVGHCYRCDTMIEPRASDQWFVKMEPLAKRALEAEAAGDVKFYPEKWGKIYKHWLGNIRDWCISRQIWWGHQIPVWYCEDCDVENVSLEDPTECSSCGSENLRQETDVLDTWFSSWLWPFSTLGWPEETSDLEKFYPTQSLVTAPDILFFWVARMIMAGLEFKDEVPFKDIYLHGVVRDDQGRKMSKSLGNSIDPVLVIEDFSADALRFSLMMLAPAGHDVQLATDKFLLGRNFSNKIWNAARYLLMNIDLAVNLGDDAEAEITGSSFSILIPRFDRRSHSNLNVIDQWILSRLNTLLQNIEDSIQKFRFNDTANAIYDFLWHDYCDWYLEMIKDRIDQETTQQIALSVLEQTLRALHPIMPFITEEIWQRLPLQKDKESIMISDWPKSDTSFISLEIEAQFAMIKDIIQSVRNVRRELNLPMKQELALVISCEKMEDKERLLQRQAVIIKLAKLSSFEVLVGGDKPEDVRAIVREFGIIYVQLKGLIDTNTEKERLQKELDKIEKEIVRLIKKLSNEGFVAKAPSEVIDKEREKKSKYEQVKAQLQSQLSSL